MGKVAGFFILGIMVILVGIYVVKGMPNTNKGQPGTAKQEETDSRTTLEPTPDETKVLVYAAGTQANDIYPAMELYIGSTVAKTWENVRGNPEIGEFEKYEYVSPMPIGESEEIGIAFTNDAYFSASEDRNLYIDKIVIGDRIYVADSPATLTLLDEGDSNKCFDGNTYSRWLRCNGRFIFKDYRKAFAPQPTPEAAVVNGSIIKVYAAGQYAGGQNPGFDLKIKNRKIVTFSNVGGDPKNRVLGEYTVTVPEKVNISDINILYTNDYYSKKEDRNLLIDRVNLDGVDYYADDPRVYQTGVWLEGECKEGYLRSKLLWCPNATMKFGARTYTGE